MRYGYACISMKLSYPQKYGGKEKGVQPITTGRTSTGGSSAAAHKISEPCN